MEKIIDESELAECLDKVTHILDARSPGEFEQDHIPGAINVPVLSNEERAEVGTLYMENPFQARKLGAAYATLTIHHFLKSDAFQSWKKKDRLLVYCARGGQRSGSLGLVLDQIGFAVYRLRKGYKSYRAHVLNHFSSPLPGPVYVLYGYTGSGKTKILNALKDDFNILDLEGYARHRGSLLGNLPGNPQPTQRTFETELAQVIGAFKPDRPTLIEGESRKVGKLAVPESIWTQMKAAKHLWLEIPREERVTYILEDYRDLKARQYLEGPVNRLARYLSAEKMQEIQTYIDASHWEPLVEQLLEHHYDPLYGRANKEGNRLPMKAASVDAAVAVVRDTILALSNAQGADPQARC